MKVKKKRNPNLSKYDAPLRIQFDRGFNAFKGKQYVKKSEIKRKAKDAGRKRWLRKLRQSEWN